MTVQQKIETIKRLAAEVEAELSLMGGVGAATGKEKKPQIDKTQFLRKFHKTIRR